MGKSLENKIAVVTGGSSGIGFATAKRFVDDGATVIITGRRQAELDAAALKLGSAAIGIRADSAKLGDLDALFSAIKSRFGRIDVLFVNAGGGPMAPLGTITEEQFDDAFNRNVKGTVFTVQKALPLLSDGASVILNGSAIGSKGNNGLSVYSASKAAVRALARNWILDLQGRNIRINALSPGFTKTDGLLAAAGPDVKAQEGMLGFLASKAPMNRVASAEEIAGVAAFLAGNDSSFITGAEILADGGQAQI